MKEKRYNYMTSSEILEMYLKNKKELIEEQKRKKIIKSREKSIDQLLNI
jgi:hypothetical protein